MTNFKEECIKSYDQQEYRILEMPINPNDPKALTRKGWNTEPTNLNIGKDNLYAVVQEDNKLTFDFDDKEFNDILSDYLDKTLVIQTGNGGRHYYFKDIKRLKPIRIAILYKNGKVIGDIKAHMSYVVGCGSSYQQDGKTKTYTKISSVDKVLEIDCEIILKILKDNGITTTKEIESKTSFKDGLKEGERNSECFKTACEIFEKRKLDFDSGLNFIKNWNSLSKKPLDDSEIEKVVKSAWDRITKKPLQFSEKDKIDKCANHLQERYTFVTLRKFEEILLYNGKIYDNLQAETLIKEKTEKLIPLCTTHETQEVINKIKRHTYTDIEDFDKDPNLITIENGILNLETLELKPHTPQYLSRVLLPVEYQKPKYEIKDETIFEDIEKNLKNTLFWKFLKSSFTVDKKFQEKEFQTALETTACPIIKRTIDEKAIMNLGKGDNGKSVLLGYIVDMLGKDNVSNIALQNLSDDKYMSSNLSGKSANIFTDLERNELKHTGLIKAIVSNEGIEVQKKYYDAFNMKPFCKLMFSANRFPKSYDQSEGFFRRWIIVKWERSFGKDPERDSHLKEKLKDNQDERNLVFSCLVKLANKLNKDGKFTHTKGWKTIQREWNENADPIDNFDTNYIIDGEKDQSKRDTYNFYKEICHEKGETPLGMGQFSKAFSEYRDEFIEKRDGKTTRVWLSIDFKRPIQTEMKKYDKEDKK